jgi:hypothetical protein
MVERHFIRPYPPPTLAIRVAIQGQDVLFETDCVLKGAVSVMARMEIQKGAGKLSKLLMQRGVEPKEIEGLLGRMITSKNTDLALVDSILDFACQYALTLCEPIASIGEAYAAALASGTGPNRPSMEAYLHLQNAPKL